MIIDKLLGIKKIGFALGGGATLGAAHIGVLRAIEELGIRIHCVSGNSIGAFVAAFYAFGIPWQEMQKIAINMKWLDISNVSPSKLSLLSNRKIGQIINTHLGDVEFEQAGIPLSIMAGDLSTGKKVVLNKGKVVDAVIASTAIPGVFRPVEMDGRLLVDGGVVENVPVSPLSAMGANYFIAVNLNARREFKKPDNIIDVMVNSYYTIITNLADAYTEKANLLILPNLAKFSLVDTKNAEKLIERGYEEAIKVLSDALQPKSVLKF